MLRAAKALAGSAGFLFYTLLMLVAESVELFVFLLLAFWRGLILWDDRPLNYHWPASTWLRNKANAWFDWSGLPD